jgi:hypothetical protein
MPTISQLRAEPWWDREIVTPELDWLGDELCRRTGQPRVAAGTKGNAAHLSGAHRSQEWILNSRWCTSRTYTVQSGLTEVQKRHIAGVDFTPGEWGSSRNRTLMREQAGRLVSALMAGRLVGVREVIGTLDGRTVVGTRADGSTFRSDDSHLDHWHLTLDRRYCANRPLMERIVAVTLGDEEDFMADVRQADWDALIWRIHALVNGGLTVAGGPTKGSPVILNVSLQTLGKKVDALATAVAGVDEAAAVALRAEFEEIDAAQQATLVAIEQAAAADAVRDAEIRDLVASALSGEQDARVVLGIIADRLREASEPTVAAPADDAPQG